MFFSLRHFLDLYLIAPISLNLGVNACVALYMGDRDEIRRALSEFVTVPVIVPVLFLVHTCVELYWGTVHTLFSLIQISTYTCMCVFFLFLIM